MADRILTTHAGSLPRPTDLIELMWAKMDGREVDLAQLEDRMRTAVAEVVAKQRDLGIDVISDGEMSKPGFSTYVSDRFSGFDGRAEFQSDDVAPFPDLAMRLFATESMAHVVFSNCVGPVKLTDGESIHRDIANFKAALGDTSLGNAFMGSISPGQIAFNYPNQHYGSHEEYLGRLSMRSPTNTGR
jgi:5-methyltetrahydropteroyltriglutamate--homocysteine methyltransferase